jgi:beta-RFAP synthase
MITVQAPSRLHFGLFNLAPDERWPNSEGELTLPARQFGGVGLMVQAPGVRVQVEPANSWGADGPLATRALNYAHALRGTSSLKPQRILVESGSREHVGLGTGTQLALAVAHALLPDVPFPWDAATAKTVAGALGRGRRSALGIHGFLHGGFLVEVGKPPGVPGVAPLLARGDLPAAWRIVLIIPSAVQGLHGEKEWEGFAALLKSATALPTTDALCRLVLLGMLPALRQAEFVAFGEALHDFNRRVGEIFAPIQGGPYSHPLVAELVGFIRKQGVAGVGQSSWGPTVFAILGDDDQAQHLARTVRERFSLQPDEVIVTAACNHGATLLDS